MHNQPESTQDNNQLNTILKTLSRHFRQAKDAIKYLQPSSKLEVNSLAFIESVLNAIRSGIAELRDYYENKERIPDISSKENDIQEMTSMAAGGVALGASKNSKKKENISEIDKLEESLVNVRKMIKESIEQVYLTDKILFKESFSIKQFKNYILNESMNSSTGMNKLIEVFNEIRKILETKYLSLTTSKDQRISFSLHLLNAISDELNRLDMNTDAGNKSEDFSNEPVQMTEGLISENDGDILKSQKLKKELPPEDEDEAFKNDFTIEGLNETGRNEALAVYNNIFPKIEDAFMNLSDREDKDIFKQYLIENLEALFEKLENQIEPEDENDSFEEIYHDDGSDGFDDNIELPEQPNLNNNEDDILNMSPKKKI